MSFIFSTIHGSHLYGLAHEGSDRDYYYVYEGTSPRLHQHINSTGTDIVRGTIEGFMRRAAGGSHQSVEALFSRQKEFAPGMYEKYGAYLDGFRVTGSEVFAKYERTIKKFCYGDEKRRRHAVRLSYSLEGLRADGRFDPTLTEDQQVACIALAIMAKDDELRDILLG